MPLRPENKVFLTDIAIDNEVSVGCGVVGAKRRWERLFDHLRYFCRNQSMGYGQPL